MRDIVQVAFDCVVGYPLTQWRPQLEQGVALLLKREALGEVELKTVRDSLDIGGRLD